LAALRGDAAERTSGAAAFAATMSGAGTSRGERGWRGAVGDSARGRDEEMVLDLSATSERREPVTEQRPLRVMVREGRRTRFVPLTDIDWFEADGNYIVVHAGNDRFRTRGTITAIEQALDPRQFVRIHRRMVVNMDRVREMSPLPGGDGLLLLSNGQHLRLSRTFRNRVR
jgi:two-component system LytT family response regulator